MKQTQLEFKSEFLPEVTIVVVFDDDPRYEQVKSYFDEYGYGFMVPGKNLIIVDGEELLNGDDNSILKFIEAHEVSHIFQTDLSATIQVLHRAYVVPQSPLHPGR